MSQDKNRAPTINPLANLATPTILVSSITGTREMYETAKNVLARYACKGRGNIPEKIVEILKIFRKVVQWFYNFCLAAEELSEQVANEIMNMLRQRYTLPEALSILHNIQGYDKCMVRLAHECASVAYTLALLEVFLETRDVCLLMELGRAGCQHGFCTPISFIVVLPALDEALKNRCREEQERILNELETELYRKALEMLSTPQTSTHM